IADELFAQGIKGVVVLADAEHLCMKMRGVRNDATLTTSAYRGIYESKEEKESIMTMIRRRNSDTTL
ncbi:MAG: GTP cyclohydrolase I, partial [Nitrosarchaeum sp.]